MTNAISILFLVFFVFVFLTVLTQGVPAQPGRSSIQWTPNGFNLTL